MPESDAHPVRLLVDRDGTHVSVVDAAGTTLHREGVGSPVLQIERGKQMTCEAMLTADGAETLARSLLIAAGRARHVRAPEEP